VRSGWQVEVRRGSSVERSRHAELADALEAVEVAAREAARSERRAPVDLRVRAFAPGDQVVARVALRGGGARAGVDVRGDGSMTAHAGRVRRAPIELRPGEGVFDALRRTLLEGGA